MTDHGPTCKCWLCPQWAPTQVRSITSVSKLLYQRFPYSSNYTGLILAISSVTSNSAPLHKPPYGPPLTSLQSCACCFLLWKCCHVCYTIVKHYLCHTLLKGPYTWYSASSSPPQKRSGMARVLSFTCTPARSSAIGMSHTCLCLPSYSWYSFTNPKGIEGWVDLDAK